MFLLWKLVDSKNDLTYKKIQKKIQKSNKIFKKSKKMKYVNNKKSQKIQNSEKSPKIENKPFFLKKSENSKHIFCSPQKKKRKNAIPLVKRLVFD